MDGEAGFSLDGDVGSALSSVATLALSRAVEVVLRGVGLELVSVVGVVPCDVARLWPICILRLATCDVAEFVIDRW